MRDHLLNETLRRLAAEAATRFSTLVASGDQIPFDVAEQEGPDSLFYRYEPLTSRFVFEREDELRSLPAFVPARDAVATSGIAGPYLEARGESIPASPGERAARMLVVFTASLWEGSTEFSLDRARLDNALDVLDAEVRGADEADVLIVPLVGLRMSLARLELPHGMQVVRADAIEAPPEAIASEGMERAAWEPQFLAVAEQEDGPDSAGSALMQLRELVSVMRLFKTGGIGLGPYAFAPTGEGHWRRIATGAPATRPGGYTLSGEEAEELTELAATLESRPDPDGALGWAIARFEMGCARESSLEGLSDHLLALRSVLEGHGPVGASLPMRAAALICDESLGRIEAGERVEKVLELERSLMNGTPATGSHALATWAESGVRRILREAALGELGADLGTAAEESLIVSGLEAGDGTIVDTAAEWETPDAAIAEAPEPAAHETENEVLELEPETREAEIEISRMGSEGHEAEAETREAEWEVKDFEVPAWEKPGIDEGTVDQDRETWVDGSADGDWDTPDTGEVEISVAHPYDEQDTRILEPIPEANEIRITATNWLDEVSVEESTLDFPAVEGDVEHRERIDTPRVRHLFPVPEDADWQVRELKYNRRRAG